MKTFLGPPFTFAWPLGTAVWEGLLFLSRYILQMVFELDRTEIARTDSSLLIGDIEANTIRASPSLMYPIRGGLSYSEDRKYIVCMVVVKIVRIHFRVFWQALPSTLSSTFSTAARCHTFLIQNTKWSKKCRTHWSFHQGNSITGNIKSLEEAFCGKLNIWGFIEIGSLPISFGSLPLSTAVYLHYLKFGTNKCVFQQIELISNTFNVAHANWSGSKYWVRNY